MNMEKGFLVVAVLFVAVMASFMLMRRGRTEREFAVDRAFVPRTMVTEPSAGLEAYRLKGSFDPFQERSASRTAGVKIGLPDAPAMEIAPPPAFLKKEEF
ncbi:MAG: hypothetical protein ABIF71_06230 [Planctomycetota bacterium]